MGRMTDRWMGRAGCLAGALILGLALAGPALAQSQTGFVSKVFRDDAGEHRYTVFVPQAYQPSRPWPVILYLHGAGERGRDGMLPTTIGLGPFVRERAASFPFIVVFPQVEDPHGRILTAWLPGSPDGQRALKILDQVERDYRVEPRQRVLSGWSMGGYGAWALAAAFPERWSAVVPISGGGDPATAELLTKVPIWAVHGTKDALVRVDESRKMIEAVRKAGGTLRYSEPAEGDHDVWRLAYDSDNLYAWMLNPSSSVPAELNPRQRNSWEGPMPGSPPFVPALDIPRAVYLRLGNDSLKAIADSAPAIIKPQDLVGRLADTSDSTEVQGLHFDIYFSNMSYSAQLDRAALQSYRKDRLSLQLWMHNLQVTIGNVYVQGPCRKAAWAGPMQIVVGFREPVIVSLDARPYVENRRLRLELVNSYFRIPADNWYVTPPASVETRGWFMTSERVSRSLVEGLQKNKGRLEEQVIAALPGLMTELENRITFDAADKVVSGIWPLPVYQPQLKAWVNEVDCDRNGLSLVLGLTAGAVDPFKPAPPPQLAPPVSPGLASVPRATGLQVGIAPGLLTPLSELLVREDVTRVHVLDTPAKSLAQLVDRQVMQEIVPDLKATAPEAELWTELRLAAPVQTGNSSQPEYFVLQLPRLVFAVSIKKTARSARYEPYLEIDANLQQDVRPYLVRTGSNGRGFGLNFEQDPRLDVQTRFAPGYTPQDTKVDTDRLREILLNGWREMTRTAPEDVAVLPDLDMGYAVLRADSVRWENPFLAAAFGPAGVRLMNRTNSPVQYETRLRSGPWSPVYTIEPGTEQYIRTALPLELRFGGWGAFPVPAGSSAAFIQRPDAGPQGLWLEINPVEGGAPKPAPLLPSAKLPTRRRAA